MILVIKMLIVRKLATSLYGLAKQQPRKKLTRK